MSFFGKFKTGSAQTGAISKDLSPKKDPNAPQPTALEKHLADATGAPRPDGSDKFFGFENYGSTCYCNSIIQCLYYSAPFRDHVINFPSRDVVEEFRNNLSNGAPPSPRATSTTPYPNLTSPARKENAPGSPGPNGQKQEESKDSPEYRKKMALKHGPVLDMTYDNSTRYGMDESLFTSLRDIFEAIIGNQSRIGVVSPHRFLEILRRENEMFRSAMHQDAHEFLNLLLNQVIDNVEFFAKQHPALLAPQPKLNGSATQNIVGSGLSISTKAANTPAAGLDTHWVHDLFEGLLTSETRCLTCENTSQRDEAFLDLSVDLSAHTSVTSCLRKFSEEEMLCERNKFHCDNCGGLQEAEKRMKIKRLPRILALHLKRFKYTEDLQRLQKLFHRVVYPFYLRLWNTTDDAEDPDRLYELYSVVVHIGGGPYHGHYVSIVKTQDRGWLLFDDELVEPVDKSYVMNFFGGEVTPGGTDAKQLACAYVLFYQETTMEAMLKEQEAEEKSAAMATRVSDAETFKDPSSPAVKNGEGLSHTFTYTGTAPGPHELDHMEMLAHASTAPDFPNAAAAATSTANGRPHLDHLSTAPLNPIMPTKSKKELKQEEKEREKAAKAAKKAEEKAADEKRMEAIRKRQEQWKRQDEEMKAVMEMSKQTAADEAKTRGDEVPKEKEGGVAGGFARFRPGSMSLRKKPTIFSKDRNEKPPANGIAEEDHSSEPNGTSRASAGAVIAARAAAEKTSATTATATPASVQAVQQQEEKTKRNRFSLGKKKSTVA